MNIGNQKGDMLSNVYLLILRLFLPVFTFYFVFQPKLAKISEIIGGAGVGVENVRNGCKLLSTSYDLCKGTHIALRQGSDICIPSVRGFFLLLSECLSWLS